MFTREVAVTQQNFTFLFRLYPILGYPVVKTLLVKIVMNLLLPLPPALSPRPLVMAAASSLLLSGLGPANLAGTVLTPPHTPLSLSLSLSL